MPLGNAKMSTAVRFDG